MRSARVSLGFALTSLAASGCLGPDLGFVGGGGEGGSGATTTTSTTTTSSSTAGGGDGSGGSPATTTTSTTGPGGGAGGTGGGPQCGGPQDCPDPGDACLQPTCDAGACGTSPLPDGTQLPNQVPGDCLVITCSGGNTVADADDADVPDDFNDCTLDACDAGVPSNTDAPADTPCGVGGDLFCDGLGACIGCGVPEQCAGTDDDCKARTCDGGICGVDFQPSGTLATPLAGNCAEEVCDGAGNVQGNIDDSDVPDDFNECTDDRCVNGLASNPGLAPGTACGDGPSCTEPPATAKAQDVCDGAGTCNVQVPQTCTVASQCLVPVCNGDSCAADFAPPDARCDLFGALDGFCDGFGTCVECNGDGQCPGTEVCDASGACVATEKIVFVTSSIVRANFGGVDAGDAICQTVATSAGLTGTFRAWLSASGSSPATTFTQASVPYRLRDGTTIADGWADLVDGTLLAGISVTEGGADVANAEVWTGTTALGTGDGNDCNGWTTLTDTGFVGLSGTVDRWSEVYSQFCDRDNVRLYCFEQ